MRLMEVLLHAGTAISGFTASMIHERVVSSFGVKDYCLPQLRYDLRKLKAHGLLERDGKHYAYHLTDKGVKVAIMFVLFHKRLCGPIANSLFHHRTNPQYHFNTKIEKAYEKVDNSISQLIDFLEAA